MHILVTGMSGLIGGAVRRQLEPAHRLSALNRSEIPGVACHRADIGDLDAILPAFRDVETVVHLAAIANMAAPWAEILQTNVIGTYNVFEAARRSGVRRVIYASSGATVAGYEREQPYKALVAGDYSLVDKPWPVITHEWPARPGGLYGASKVWGETLARHFTDTSDLSILCLRIGHVIREDRPASTRDYSIWCSQRDIVQMIERCIAAPDSLKFDVFFVLSDNQWGYRDIEHPRRVVGYAPQDAAEAHRA